MRGSSLVPLLAATLILAAPTGSVPAAAQEAAEPAPAVELDRLLTLPSDFEYSVETRGGRTKGKWRSRFRDLREALAAEKTALAEAEDELADVASSSSQWSLAPPFPGAAEAATDAPVDFQLRRRIDGHREEIEVLEQRLQELEIEANLAGVPEEWRS